MALTKEQFTQLYNKGLSVQQIRDFEAGQTPQTLKQNQPQEKGFLRSMIEDPIKTLIVTPAARFSEVVGRRGLLGSNIKRGYEEMTSQDQTFGGINIPRQKGFDEGGASQILGEAAKTASYLYTPGVAKGALQTGLKGQVISGALQGAKAGAIGGGSYSFGDAVQRAENSTSDVAYKTLFGAGVGGATGGLLGATVPLIVKTVNGIKSYTDINQLNEKLYTKNKEILRPTSTQMDDWKTKKVDPIKTLVQEFGPDGIPTTGDKLDLGNLIEMTDARYKAGSAGFNTILRNSPETVSLKGVYQKSVNDIKNSVMKDTLKEKALAKIKDEFGAIIRRAKSEGTLLGTDNIPAWYADNLKDGFWGSTKNFGSEVSTVDNAVNRSLGFGFKEGIENAVTDVNVRAYNKQLQQLMELSDFLSSQNGKVPGTGGKMVRYTSRIIGGIAGSGGGPGGSVIGSITADKVAQAMINPNAKTWIIRKQLEKLTPEARASLQAEAEQIIQNMIIKRGNIPKLGVGVPGNIPIPLYGTPDLGQQAGKVFNQSSVPNNVKLLKGGTPAIPLPGKGILQGMRNIK